MIDLHLHTTASDGRSAPEDLMARAHGAGLRTVAVTDHDTMAGVPAAWAAADRLGLAFVPGIELTTVQDGRDVHILAYFLDPQNRALSELIVEQRRRRVERARAIGEALGRMGAPIDLDGLVGAASSRSGKVIARPQIARALIDAGHVSTVAEAFDRYLGESCAAYVPHTGASPADAIALVRRQGGIASLAHPGPLGRDDLIDSLVDAGLQAIEAYHSSHDEPTTARYLTLARRYGLSVTGGSDYHGEGVRRAEFFGVTHLPAPEFAAFLERAGRSETWRRRTAGPAPDRLEAGVLRDTGAPGD